MIPTFCVQSTMMGQRIATVGSTVASLLSS